MRRWASLILAVLIACSGASEDPVARPSPEGPPAVQPEVVRRHAEQFDGDLPDRVAGSQQELAASTYILGTLQRAGYVVRLDPVPVGDLVNSSNVIALPPSGNDPQVLVVTGYEVRTGMELGLFLELARALMVLNPDHDVGFVALAADAWDEEGGGALGSRRLARFLLDEGQEPDIIRPLSVGHTPGLAASGPAAEALTAIWCNENDDRDACNPVADDLDVGFVPDPLGGAGFDHTFVSGDPEVVGRVLLEYLSR